MPTIGYKPNNRLTPEEIEALKLRREREEVLKKERREAQEQNVMV